MYRAILECKNRDGQVTYLTEVNCPTRENAEKYNSVLTWEAEELGLVPVWFKVEEV